MIFCWHTSLAIAKRSVGIAYLVNTLLYNQAAQQLNNILDGGAGTDILIGGLGDDVYYVDDSNDSITEEVAAGIDIVYTIIDYALSENIENLTLTGTVAIEAIGNELNNIITGNELSNVLDGSDGIDTLIGGLGDDIYVVDNTNDIITENANEGMDTVYTSINYALSGNIENLTLIGTEAINGTGNASNNTITGNELNNTLDGGAGLDTLIGGDGNDIYIVDSTTDTITENVGEGIDTIQSNFTYTIAAGNVENLTLTGTAAINGTGNELNNVITGNGANNILDGGGGIDTLIGGLGDDIYVVDSATDTITENVGEGIDTIQSSVTYTILAANVENLTLTGTAVINGTGNELNNVITGNGANNILDGGAGNDTLIGGLGDDIYIVDSTTDTITENANAGTDTIQSSITYTIAAANVENLTLTGAVAINGIGNAANNVITGNSANNTLDGGAGNDTLDGSAGTDTLIGGLGDDIYVVDSTTDTITENANAGTDTIQSSVTLTLATNVENLTLTGTTVINGTGNAGNNVITGNIANNTLNGAAGNDTLDGGAGTDSLIGGTGNDIYIVDSTTDIITENANEGTDTIRSSVTWTLATNIENLTLTGTTVINGTGNAANNVFAANFAAQFTFGTRTFVAINNATAGFSATTDAIIEVTGLTGTLALTNFTTTLV